MKRNISAKGNRRKVTIDSAKSAKSQQRSEKKDGVKSAKKKTSAKKEKSETDENKIAEANSIINEMVPTQKLIES